MALSLGQKAGWGLADMGVVVFVVVKQLLVFAYLTSALGVMSSSVPWTVPHLHEKGRVTSIITQPRSSFWRVWMSWAHRHLHR